MSKPKKPKKNIQNGSEWYLGRLRNPFLYGKETREYHAKNYGDADYYDFLPIFEEESADWDPEAWAKFFVEVGADYVVFTAKHHDGVAMYPSAYGKYHTSRDYVGELEKALRGKGIKFGIYYSLMQWGIGKKGKNYENYVKNVMHPQLREIVTRYNPDILWADGDWTNTVQEWNSVQFLKWLHKYNKNIIVNSRWGKNFIEDYREKLLINSFLTPTDRYIPSTKTIKWEHVNTISNSWGFNKNQARDDYKQPFEILILCRMVEKLGGNFMINLGPKPNGEFDEREKTILSRINLQSCDLNYSNKHVSMCIHRHTDKYTLTEIIAIINQYLDEEVDP